MSKISNIVALVVLIPVFLGIVAELIRKEAERKSAEKQNKSLIDTNRAS